MNYPNSIADKYWVLIRLVLVFKTGLILAPCNLRWDTKLASGCGWKIGKLHVNASRRVDYGLSEWNKVDLDSCITYFIDADFDHEVIKSLGDLVLFKGKFEVTLIVIKVSERIK